MSIRVYYTIDGKIVSTTNHVIYDDTLKYIQVDFIENPFSYYIDSDNLIKMPLAPSIYHYFDYKTKKWMAPDDTTQILSDIRYTRDQLLQASDWTQLPDVPLTTKENWAVYRQALRDITDQPDPFNIVWPVAPL